VTAATPLGRPLTAIVTPLAEELAALRAATEVAEERRVGAWRFFAGRLAGAPVVLASTGDARQWAARGLIALLDAYPVERLVVLGVAGGLSPRLETGALILAARVREGAGEAPPPDPAWRERALASGRAVAGTVVTAEFILPYPAMKAALWRTLPGGGPAAVDLETAVYARIAARRGIPYLAVRAVLDPAEEELPLDFNLCRRADGRVSRGQVMRRTVFRPRRFGELVRLRRRVQFCSQRLADLAGELLAA
jgi:adenosylhomocysteine nucleosidase